MADSTVPFPADPLPAGSRIACRIEYDGSHYSGWQAQSSQTLPTREAAPPDVATVQQTLEAALAEVACAPVRVHCAGRTDSGVHGFAQVIHFDAPVERSARAWVLGTNACLPLDIRVHWAVVVAPDFHARFSALSREYRYLVANTRVRPALAGRQVTWQRRPLDAPVMHAAAQYLLGEQDFSAFRAAACQSSTPMRNVHSLDVSRHGDLVVVTIRANAFLHHMVRNIVGSLLVVGSGQQSPQWIAQLLQGRDRTVAAATAPADGLYLVGVQYPARYPLPAVPNGPLLLWAQASA